MSKIDKAFSKTGKLIDIIKQAVEDFDPRWLVVIAIFGLGVVVGLLF